MGLTFYRQIGECHYCSQVWIVLTAFYGNVPNIMFLLSRGAFIEKRCSLGSGHLLDHLRHSTWANQSCNIISLVARNSRAKNVGSTFHFSVTSIRDFSCCLMFLSEINRTMHTFLKSTRKDIYNEGFSFETDS